MGLLYRSIRLLTKLALSIFFSEVQVLGLENVPLRGPVIVVGNHKNQFVDPMVVVSYVARPVSFLIAEKSMHRRIIGDIARWMNSIPVIRPQDRSREGHGTFVGFDPESCSLLASEDASLADLKPGEHISLKGMGRVLAPLVVVSVDGRRVQVKPPVRPEDDPESPGAPTTLKLSQPTNFKIIPKINQSDIFARVFQSLARGEAIGIFPEGGSSDRTDLLPLKAGVAVMALGAASEGTDVKVVPFGINYTRGHRWRSRIVVDVGRPVVVPAELAEAYRDANKRREAQAEFLKSVEAALRGVTLNAPDMRSLQILRTMRRMYQGEVPLPPKRFMELNRRFAAAFAQFRGDERFMDLVEQVHDYMSFLSKLLLTDRQVAAYPPTGSFSASVGALVKLSWDVIFAVGAALVSLPCLIIFGPMLWRVDRVVRHEVRKALAGSSVKVKAEDVAASQKIIGSFIWLPTTMILWTVIPGLLLGFLWPRSVPVTWAPGLVADTPEAWLFLNVPWIVPLLGLVLMLPYAYVVMLLGEHALRGRGRMMSHIWLICAFGRAESRSTAGKIRIRRKELALRIQDFFQKIVIPTIPEWRDDPIIDFDLIRDHRRPSDYGRATLVAAQVDELAQRAPSSAAAENGVASSSSSRPGSPASPLGANRRTIVSLKGSMQTLDTNKVAGAVDDQEEE